MSEFLKEVFNGRTGDKEKMYLSDIGKWIFFPSWFDEKEISVFIKVLDNSIRSYQYARKEFTVADEKECFATVESISNTIMNMYSIKNISDLFDVYRNKLIERNMSAFTHRELYINLVFLNIYWKVNLN